MASSTYRLAKFVVDVMCQVVGRRNVMRAAGFALSHADTDSHFNIQFNGEVALQRWILDLLPSGGRVHVIDVGANVGHWSRQFLDLAESQGRLDEVDLHAFEPGTDTFRQLTEALGNSRTSLQQFAVSDHPRKMTLHIAPGASALNSLYMTPGLHTALEDIAATTLDAYAQRASLSRIDLLKIDAEGHDLEVLKGASGLLRQGRIAVAQFKYNEFWIHARHYLKDAFGLLEPLGYRLGRLTPFGIEFCPSWNSGLETFRAAMYVACGKDVAERLPRVAERHRVAADPESVTVESWRRAELDHLPLSAMGERPLV